MEHMGRNPLRIKPVSKEENEMEIFSPTLSGKNGVMDWGLWLLLIALVAIYFWLAFRRRK